MRDRLQRALSMWQQSRQCILDRRLKPRSLQSLPSHRLLAVFDEQAIQKGIGVLDRHVANACGEHDRVVRRTVLDIT